MRRKRGGGGGETRPETELGDLSTGKSREVSQEQQQQQSDIKTL